MKHIGDDLVVRLIKAARVQDVVAEELFALAADCILLGKEHERAGVDRMFTIGEAVKLANGCFRNDAHGEVIGVAVDLALAGRAAWRAEYDPTQELKAS
jgi:hypothetical protein